MMEGTCQDGITLEINETHMRTNTQSKDVATIAALFRLARKSHAECNNETESQTSKKCPLG